jgi:hypothetical protein
MVDLHRGGCDNACIRVGVESFSKAVEQLGSKKLEVRLGGIYSLERISKESPDDYWTVMENLTAFVRERSRRNEAERTALDLEQRVSRRAYSLWQKASQPDGRAEEFWAEAVNLEKRGEPPAADIAAVMSVIKRRSDRSRERESANRWHLDLGGAVLKLASLFRAHLEGAYLWEAHLERAGLGWAHLEGAYLWEAHLEGADLTGADLTGVHLRRADLTGAHLEGALLLDAHLEGADLADTMGLSEAQLADAHGDAATRLPDGMVRPAHWPEATASPGDTA